MALACKVDIDKIRQSIEKTVARSATNSGLFDVVDDYILIPKAATQDIINEALSYQDDVRGIYKDALKADPIDFLKEMANQIYSSTSEAKGARDVAGERMISLAERVFPRKSQLSPITPSERVDYSLDAIKKLSSPKANEIFTKGQKNNWDLSKILTELQLQKEQKELILSTGLAAKETIIDSLLNNFSFTVEVNTATQFSSKDQVYADTGIFNYNGNKYFAEGSREEGDFQAYRDYEPISEQEFREALINSGTAQQNIPTQHYANMTVPGGTNYTELRFTTPDITPSIKGHAAFAEDNDIGWVRSDEQTIGQPLVDIIDGYGNPVIGTEGGVPTKTRRILEIQADLFQKGRNNDLLIPTEGNTNATLEDFNSKESLENFENKLKTNPDNQFLQLLNKDNNWVTFFVKAIIQDSAKKGYEKVLFPSGDTAAKVEGHNTLEEFKSMKEGRLRQLEESQYQVNKVGTDFGETEFFASRELAENYINSKGSKEDYTIDLTGQEEIVQLKQELERVEREGFGALMPIHKFYQETIQNILKKRGYNPTEIIDEYGNKWFQVDVDEWIKNSIQERIGKLPTTQDHNHVVSAINSSFSEPIIKKLGGGVFRIDPSTDTINQAMQIYLKANPDQYNERGVKPEKRDDLVPLAGLEEGDTPLDFINKYSLAHEEINAFLKANPEVKFQFDDDAFSQFDPHSNTISISLSEAYSSSVARGVPFKQVIDFLIQHEIGHAVSYFALETGNNAEFIKEIYSAVRPFHDKNPFIDHMRQGFEKEGLPYAFWNEHEFTAEAFSNPYFIEYLKTVPFKKEGISAWDKIINFFRSLFGLGPKDNAYDATIGYINSEKIRRDNIEGSLTPWLSPMSIVYRGNPKDYISATYDYFVDPTVSGQMDAILKKLPAAVIDLKNALNKENNQERRRQIQRLLDSYNEVKGNEKVIPVYINMLLSADRIAIDLNNQLINIDSLDEDKRIPAAYSLYVTAKHLDNITPLINDVLRIMRRETYGPSVGTFVQKMERIISIKDDVSRTFKSITMPYMISYFTSLNSDNETAKVLSKQFNEFRVKLDDPNLSPLARKSYENKMEKITKEMLKVPSQQVFEKIFHGEYVDASSAQMNLEAIFLNSHPLIQGIALKMRDLDIEVSQNMLSIENDHQKMLDSIVKSNNLPLRDPSITWAPITTTFKWVKDTQEVDGILSHTHISPRMLLSSYTPEYLQESLEYQAKRNFYFDKYLKARRDNNDADEDKYYGLYNQAIAAQRVFQRENSELRYLPEVYTMFDLMDKEISKADGTKTTFRRERGDIFVEIEDLEHRRDSATNMEDQNAFQNLIKEKYIDLKQIRSPWDKYSNQKQGYELELSNIANQYSDMRNKLGTYILTPEGQASFDREMASIEKNKSTGYLNVNTKQGKEQYEAAINSITVTELEDKYYDELDRLTALVQKATGEILQIAEIAALFKARDVTKLKEGYTKLRQLTAGFRDNEGIIDGGLFSKVRPDAVKEIKAIQEAIENLKNEASKLTGLSVHDSVRYKMLINKLSEGSITDDERDEMNELQRTKESGRTAYKNNKPIIDDYYKLLGALASLTEASVSDYYVEAKDEQLNLIAQQERENVEKEMKTSQILEGGRFFKTNDKWYKLVETTDAGERVVSEIIGEKGLSAEEKVVNEVSTFRATIKLESSEWWTNNHYTRYAWDEGSAQYAPVESPIYIWVRTEPKNKEYIKAGQPSIKFKTYKIHDGTIDNTKNYLNSNFREIYPFIPINKAGKYDNPAYFKLKNSSNPNDRRMFGYLEWLREGYYDAQKMYPSNKKMGDILPGVIRTKEENRVIATNKAFKAQTYKDLAQFGAGAGESEDTQLLLGGSQSTFYSANRALPIRFTDKIDSSKQSADVPSMILTFIQSATRYTKFLEAHPYFETARIIAEDLQVLEQRSTASKFGIKNIFAAIKSDSKKVDSIKDTKKSNLSKTMDYMLDTFLYEERKDYSVSNIAGMKFDWQKASSNLKRMSSLSIFTLNAFAALKNTGSAKVQGIIFSNIGKGFYTKTDFARAQGEVAKYIKDFWHDYKKFGDKSFIGQALQYFQVMHGSMYNEYGKKTQWTTLKNTENWLTWMKNSSEYELQVTQFLAMSRANKVKLNGQMVDMLDAFELDKDKNFVIKKGAEVDDRQIKQFTKRISYVNRIINGAYREDEKNKLQKSVLGDLAFYLNGYIMPALTARYAGTRYSGEADMITKGHWNQGMRFVADLLKYRQGIKEEWGSLRDEEKARVMRFGKELSIIVSMIILYAALGAGDDKKDLKENTAFHNFLLAQLTAIKSDTETFAPLPGMGLTELARKMNSPFVALRQVTNILKVVQSSMDYVVQDGNAYYKNTQQHDGIHEKGDPKIVANFLRLLGYTGTQFDPTLKLQRLNQLQQLK